VVEMTKRGLSCGVWDAGVVWNVMWLWAWWGGRYHPAAFVIAEQGEYVVDSHHVVIPASEPVSRKPPHFELTPRVKSSPELRHTGLRAGIQKTAAL
jgi:hypothetical protein